MEKLQICLLIFLSHVPDDDFGRRNRRKTQLFFLFLVGRGISLTPPPSQTPVRGPDQRSPKAQRRYTEDRHSQEVSRTGGLANLPGRMASS